MVLSLIITVTVSLLTKAPDEKTLYESFEKPLENEIK
jgi:hypothetical protein